jgi:ribosome biogenesis GTPase
VGKSSLINALDPTMDIDVQTVSRFNEKGRHTTRRARLHELEGGACIIDTPGVRQLLVAGVTPEEIGLYFPEIEELGARCRFRDCRHMTEPGCAVLEALEKGELSPLRYRSYLGIRESVTQDEPWR